MNITKTLRELAKSSYYQNIFLAAKEINGMFLFRNNNDFSHLQNVFLSYLYFYENLNKDIILKNLPAYIHKDELYEDAYMLWKQKNDNKLSDNDKKGEKGLHIRFAPEIHHKKR